MNSSILPGKDPSDIKDYGINWVDVLAAEGETDIATSTWSESDPVGLTVQAAAPYLPSVDGTTCIVWVSGGTAGTTYSLINTIITAGLTPRTHQRTIIIPCVQR